MRNKEYRDILEAGAAATSRFDLWFRLSNHVPFQCIAEVGVWKGEFAKFLLTGCPAIQRYYLIDPWARLNDWNKPFNVDRESFECVFAEALTNTDFAADRRVILRGRTKEVAGEIPDRSIDLAYIDGDHTLRGITIDLINMLPKVKEGGFLAGDDFNHDPWHHGNQFEPTLVCPFATYFAEAVGLPIILLKFNQFLIHNDPGAGFSIHHGTHLPADLSLRSLLQ